MRHATFTALLLLIPLHAQDPVDSGKEPPAPPAVGQKAPVFRLNDHTGRAVSVGGPAETWTVVAFYPKAATPG